MAKSSLVRLAVQIVEGTNFHHLDKNSSLLLRGKIEGVVLDTDPVPLSSMRGLRLEIGEELVWKMSQRNFQRIKASKALKLECFVFLPGGGPSTSVGYIIINLKSVTDSSQSMFGWRKLLGCSHSDTQSTPQLLMSIALLENDATKETEKKLSLDKRVEEINGRPTEINIRNGVTYVGSERFCKERFQFSCTLHKATNIDKLLTDKESVSKKPFRLQIKLLGQVLNSANFDPSQAMSSFNQLFVFDVLSKTNTLKQFLTEHPPVEVSLMQSDSVICQAKHFMDNLSLEAPTSAAIFLYRHNAECEQQPKVTLTLMISALDSALAASQTVMREANMPTPSAPPLLLDDDTEEIEIVSEFSKLDNEHSIFEPKGDILSPRQPVNPPFNLKHMSRANSTHSKEPVKETKDYESERMVKVVEELEDWKLQQKMLFEAQMKSQKEQLYCQWECELKERQLMLEYEQLNTIQKTKDLSSNLEKEIEKLKQKEIDIQNEGDKFKRCAKVMEGQLAEQNRTIKAQQEEYESKINILMYQNKQLQQKVAFLEAENAKIKSIQKSNQSAEVLELKEKLREMELSVKKAEEEKNKIVREQALQRVKNAAAKEQTNSNAHRGNFHLEQEQARLMHHKDSLEKLKSDLMSVKENSTHYEPNIEVMKLLERRDALLKTGVYNEESDVVKGLDEAITKARS